MQLLSELGAKFGFASRMLTLLTSDFSEEDWSRRLYGVNSPHWVLGHITVMRRAILRMIGQPAIQLEWETTFGMSASGDIPSSAPTPAALLEEFHATSVALANALPKLPEQVAESEIPSPLPDGSRTVGQALMGLYMHECYHLGQIGLMRRLQDKPGIA